MLDAVQMDKDQALAEMQEELKGVAPLQFKENVAVVKEDEKELDQVLQHEQRRAGTSHKVRRVPLGCEGTTVQPLSALDGCLVC